MAEATALYSLISGIGGALIGGVAGVYGPVRIDKRRREHERGIESQRRLDEALAQEQAAAAEEQRLQAEEKQKVLTAIAAATVALQNWHRLITRTLQDVEVGREVDVSRFDESTEPVMHSVVEAISLVSNETFHSMRWSQRPRDWPVDPEVAGVRGQPATHAMHRLTLGLRHQLIAPYAGYNASGNINRRANGLRDDLMRAFMAERDLRVGPPITAGEHHVVAAHGLLMAEERIYGVELGNPECER